MFNPKAYLRDLIVGQLAEWVDNISPNSVNVGILNGDLQLSNLILKKKSWNLSESLAMSLEYGSINKFSVQIPWSTIHSGLVHVFVDQISIVLRLSILEHNPNPNKLESGDDSANNDNLSHELKMNKLAIEELKLLGHDEGAITQSWLSKYLGNMANAFITKIAAKFSMLATNIKLSVLLPHSNTECALIKLNLNSIDIGNAATKSSSSNKERQGQGWYEYFLSKSIQVRHLSMSLQTVRKPNSHRDILGTLKESGTHRSSDHSHISHTVLNPCNATIHVVGRSDRRGGALLGSGASSRTVSVNGTINNIELTPTTAQLTTIKNCAEYLKESLMIYKFQAIRYLTRNNENLSLRTPSGAAPSSSGGLSSTASSGKPSSSGLVPDVTSKSNASAGTVASSGSAHHATTATGGGVGSSSTAATATATASHPTGKIPFNARELWQFAIRAVLLLVRSNSSSVGGGSHHLKSGIARLSLRRQYILLYRTMLEAKLGVKRPHLTEGTDSSTDVLDDARFVNDMDKISAEDLNGPLTSSIRSVSGIEAARSRHLENGLTLQEQIHLDDIHHSSIFSVHDLVLFRAAVHQDLQKRGYSTAQLIEILVKKRQKNGTDQSSWSFFGLWSGAPPPAAAPAVMSSTSTSGKSVPGGLLTEPDVEDCLLFELDCSVARLAITLYESQVVNQNNNASFIGAANTPSPMKSAMPRPSTVGEKDVQKRKKDVTINSNSSLPSDVTTLRQEVSLVFYGLYSHIQSASDSDRIITLAAGVVKCFGHKGEEVLQWGNSDPNEWLEGDFSDRIFQGNPDLALSMSLQWRQCEVEIGTLPTSLSIPHSGTSDTNDTESLNSGDDVSVDEDTDRSHYSSSLKIQDTNNESFLQSVLRRSDKHIVLELSMSAVNIHYNQRTCIFVTELGNNLWPSPPPLVKPKPFLDLKLKFGLLSQFRSRLGVYDPATKISVDVSAAGIAMTIPVHAVHTHNHSGHLDPTQRFAGGRNTQHHALTLSIGRISVQAGDYLESFIAMVEASNQDRTPKVETQEDNAEKDGDFDDTASISGESVRRARFESADSIASMKTGTTTSTVSEKKETSQDKLKKLLVKLKQEPVRPIYFSISNIELYFAAVSSGHNHHHHHHSHHSTPAKPVATPVYNDYQKRSLTILPWSVCGVVSVSSVPCDVSCSETRLDLIFSKFKLALSTQDILEIIDIVNAVTSIFLPIVNELKVNPVPPRVKKLAALPTLFLDLTFESVEFMFIKDSLPIPLVTVVSNILNSYGNIVQQRGCHSFVSEVKRDLAVTQLMNVGFSKKLSDGLIVELLADIVDSRQSVAESVAVICENLSDTLNSQELFSILTDAKEKDASAPKTPTDCEDVIFALVLTNLQLIHYCLTYDSKMITKIEDFQIYDADRNPMLHIGATLKEKLEEFHFMDEEETDFYGRGRKFGKTAHPSKHYSKTRSEHNLNVNQNGANGIADEYRISGTVTNDVYSDSFDKAIFDPKSALRKNKSYALLFMSEAKDFAEEFGCGGYNVSILYNSKLSSAHYALREGCLELQTVQIEVLVSTNSVHHVLSQVIPSISRVQNHHSSSRALHRKMSFVQKSAILSQQHHHQSTSLGESISGRVFRGMSNASLPLTEENLAVVHGENEDYVHKHQVHLSLNAKFNGISIILAHNERYLSQVSLYQVGAQLSDVYSVMNSFMVDGTIQALSMFDLSDLGALHSEVLWSRTRKSCKALMARPADKGIRGTPIRKSMAQPQEVVEPMLAFSLSQTKKDAKSGTHTAITLDVHGLRANFLFRHLMELLDFFSSSLTGPVKLIIAPLFNASVDMASEPSVDDFQLDIESQDSRSSSDYSTDDDSLPDSLLEAPHNHDFTSPMASRVLFPGTTDRSTDPRGGFGGVATPAAPIAPEVDLVPSTFELTIKGTDISVIAPRNSNSRDLVGLTVKKVVMGLYYVEEEWTVPTKEDNAAAAQTAEDTNTQPFHYDLNSCKWVFQPVTPKEEVLSGAKKRLSVGKSKLRHSFSDIYGSSDDEDLFFDAVCGDFDDSFDHQHQQYIPYRLQPTTTDSDGNTSSTKPSRPKNVLRLALDVTEANAYCSFPGPLVYKKESELANPLLLFDSEEHKLYCEIMGGMPVNDFRKKGAGPVGIWPANQAWRHITPDPFNVRMVLDFTDTKTKLLFCDTSDLSVLHINAAQSELYLLISIWFDNVYEAPQYTVDKINSAAAEPHFLDGRSHTATSSATVDASRSLSDSYDENHPSSMPRSRSHSNFEHVRLSNYCSKEFIEFLLNRSNFSFELMVIRAEVRIDVSIDSNYFSKPIPSASYLANLEPLAKAEPATDLNSPPLTRKPQSATRKTKAWTNDLLPVADVYASGMLFHVRFDADVIQMCASAGKFEAYDTRNPKTTLTPLVLRAASSSDPTSRVHMHSKVDTFQAQPETVDPNRGPHQVRTYGYSDFGYGFKLLPVDCEVPSDLPVKFSSILSATTNWMVMNVGVDMIDLNVSNLEVILLVSEYVSCYFRFPDFGHPGVIAMDKVHENMMPYGGVDTRVFITRPHISLIKNPLSSNSQALFLETERGLYFRYILDTYQSVRMNLNLYDLAAVLVKKYRPPSMSRGIRGSSGSGRGVRTLMEFLNLAFSYHFSSITNHIDMKLDLYTPTHAEDAEDRLSKTLHRKENTVGSRRPSFGEELDHGSAAPFVDLNKDRVNLEPAQLALPHCVYPLIDSRTHFTSNSCDIVTCYEDMLFCTQLFKDFLGTDSSGAAKKKTPKSAAAKAAQDPRPSIFCVMCFTGVRVMIVDNVLGLHLPLMQIFIEDVQCNFDRDVDNKEVVSTPHAHFSKDSVQSPKSVKPGSSRMRAHSFDVSTIMGLNFLGSPTLDTSEEAANVINDKHVMVFGKTILWGEYFNNMKKCWEPMLEKLVATVLFEKSPTRGTGLTVRFASAVHVIISGAFFRMLNDALRTMQVHADFEETKHVDAAALLKNTADAVDELSISDSQDNFVQLDFNDEYHLTMNYPRALSNSNASTSGLGINSKNQLTLNVKSQKQSSKSRKHRRGSSFNYDNDALTASSAPASVAQSIDHIPSYPLSTTFRVGFSIQNLTGQPVRYLQQWEGGKKTVQYINNGERGLLNFVASTTLIRNNQIVEETFDVQMEKQNNRNRNRKKLVGNRVALQVSGFRWLHSVQVDELGVRYEDLHSVLGRINVTQMYEISSALKLMAEVIPFSGGRMLRLRSVFTIKNNTRHQLKILASDNCTPTDVRESDGEHSACDAPFLLDAGENFYVPLALLQRSAMLSNGKSLGSLYMRPSELTPIEEELGSRSYVQPGSVEYTTDPINLHQTVVQSLVESTSDKGGDNAGNNANYSLDFNNVGTMTNRNEVLSNSATMQLTCLINPRQKNKKRGDTSGESSHGQRHRFSTADYEGPTSYGVTHKLPPFCYSVEVQRSVSAIPDAPVVLRKKNPTALGGMFGSSGDTTPNRIQHPPVHYTITIHPPIVLENLLPTGGIFELVHATQKRVLWSSWIAAGTAKPIHTVTLDEPLLLLINLKYCRTSEGALVHQPNKGLDNNEGIAGKIQKTLEGLLEDTDREDISSIVLTDTVGQRLRLNLENILGGGGQRHIAVYCPYWIVNTSQYMFRIREEGNIHLPAGTVTLQKDGTRPVPLSSSAMADINMHSEYDITTANNASASSSTVAVEDNKRSKPHKASHGTSDDYLSEGAVFPGCYGPLHSNHRKEVSADSSLRNLFQELSFKETVELSYMFNYLEAGSMLSIRTVKVQLDDCDWSAPFSLDSVGVNQVLSTDHPKRGNLQLGFKISVAPGRLAKYTKIVRFLPRFAVINKLPMTLGVIQPTGFSGDSNQELDVSANHLRPFHLPEMFGERKIALQVSGPYARSVAFDIDQIGVFTMEIKRKTDLASIQHVNTRGAPEYSVSLPTGAKYIGIGFETDWGEENIVVKNLKPESFAAICTDIQVGDVLLAIDDEPVNGQQFDIAMTMIKSKLATGSCTITLRTVEEKLRLIRESALQISLKTLRRRSKTNQSTSSSGGGGTSAVTAPSRGQLPRSGDSINQEELMEMNVNLPPTNEEEGQKSSIMLRVELRQVESSVAIIVNEHSAESNTDYRIENKSVCHMIHYKQKGIAGNVWRSLNPGQCCVYVWEDPFKPHKLLVLTGDNLLCPSDHCNTPASANEFSDRNSATSVNFDEIGYKELIPTYKSDAKIMATVKSEGPCKILLITPSLDNARLTRELRYCTEFINEQLFTLQDFSDALTTLSRAIESFSGKRNEDSTTWSMIEDQFPVILNRLKDRQSKLIEVDSHLNPLPVVPHAASTSAGDTNKMHSDLCSFKSFDRPLSGGIRARHQLLVEVLEGKELTPFVVGRNEDVYCKVFLRSENIAVKANRKYRQTFTTYVCEQTLDPAWINQRFLLDVPERAASESRGFSLSVVVKSRSVIGIDASMGKADIQFSCLKNEEAIEGWFPLRPTRANNVFVYKISGSIKLRLQWVHSDLGYARYLIKEIRLRQQDLGLQLTVQRFAMRQLIKQDANKGLSTTKKNDKDFYALFSTLAKKEQHMGEALRYRRMSIKDQINAGRVSVAGPVGDSPSPVKESELAKYKAQRKSLRDLNVTITPAETSTSKRRGSAMDMNAESTGEHNESKELSASGPGKRLGFEEELISPRFIPDRPPQRERSDSIQDNNIKELQSTLSLHDIYIPEWVDKTNLHEGLHDQLSSFMRRPEELLRENTTFKSRFEEECDRSFVHVHTQSGTLEITPMQALHLPENKNFINVRVSYGEETHTTFHMAPAAYLTWYQDVNTTNHHEPADVELSNGNDATSSNPRDSVSEPYTTKKDYIRASNDSLISRFKIDTLNIRGAIRVRVMSEDFPKAREIARLEIPVFNVLDCICQHDSSVYYDRWFPLLVTNDSIAAEGEMEKFTYGSISEQIEYAKFEYQPCIRLRIRWFSDESVRLLAGSRLYSRIQLPSFSLGVIDSEHAREVMQINISGVEMRHAVTTEYTDSSLNITWVQVDNQLPDPVSTVIVSPTRVKFPQPVVRLHVRKKNLLSQLNLTSFETIQLVVQELDLHVEQQTVVASWEMIKSWLQERNSSRIGTSSTAEARRSANEVTPHKHDVRKPLTIDELGFATCTELVQYELLPTLVKSTMKPEPGKRKHTSSMDNDLSAGIDQSKEYDEDRKLYIENFKIFPIKLNVSFITTPQVMYASKKGQLSHSDIRANGTMGLYSSISLFMWQVGEVVLDLTSSIADAPIFFNGFEAPHMFKKDTDVAKILQEHYLHSALGQLYKIVGSLELVGNPIGLLSSLGVGVRDFFYEPAHALITTPTEIHKIGRGVVKGAVSLVSNTADGFLGTGITITRSIGRGVSKLSMDKSYNRAREVLQRPPKTAKAAVARPFKDVGVGFYYGAVGVVKVPYVNVRRYGAAGLVPGVAKGLAGLAANPVVGVLDAVTHSGDAFRDLIKIANREPVEPIQRLRLSDLFGPDGRILPYNFSISLGTQILRVLDRSKAEKINVGNAINGGMSVLMTARNLFSGSKSESISMSHGSRRYPKGAPANSPGRGRRGSLGSIDAKETPRPASMIVRMNRFSFRANTLGTDESGEQTLDSMYAESSRTPEQEAALLNASNPSTSMEFVIYAAIIRIEPDAAVDRSFLFSKKTYNKIPDKDLVVILSNSRVVVTEYHRRPHGAYLKKMWESPLASLTAPLFERSGAGTKLLLRSSDPDAVTYGAQYNLNQPANRKASSASSSSSVQSTDQHDSTQSVFEIKGAYHEEEVLQNLCNCIFVLRGNFESLMSIPTTNGTSGGGNHKSDCFEDDFGVVHIGPWQFVKDGSLTNTDNSLLGENQAIIKELEFEKWMFEAGTSIGVAPVTEGMAGGSVPRWLIEEQQSAIEAHSNVREIYNVCKNFEAEYAKNPQKNMIFKIAVDELFKGRLSYQEFQNSTHLADTLADDGNNQEEYVRRSILNSQRSSSSLGKSKKKKGKTSLGRSLSYFGYRDSKAEPSEMSGESGGVVTEGDNNTNTNNDDGSVASQNIVSSMLQKGARKLSVAVTSLASLTSSSPKPDVTDENGGNGGGRFTPTAGLEEGGGSLSSGSHRDGKSTPRKGRNASLLGAGPAAREPSSPSPHVLVTPPPAVASSAEEKEEDSPEGPGTLGSMLVNYQPFSVKSPVPMSSSPRLATQSNEDLDSTTSSVTVVRFKPTGVTSIKRGETEVLTPTQPVTLQPSTQSEKLTPPKSIMKILFSPIESESPLNESAMTESTNHSGDPLSVQVPAACSSASEDGFEDANDVSLRHDDMILNDTSFQYSDLNPESNASEDVDVTNSKLTADNTAVNARSSLSPELYDIEEEHRFDNSANTFRRVSDVSGISSSPLGFARTNPLNSRRRSSGGNGFASMSSASQWKAEISPTNAQLQQQNQRQSSPQKHTPLTLTGSHYSTGPSIDSPASMVMLMNRLDRLETLLSKALGVELNDSDVMHTPSAASGAGVSSGGNNSRFSFSQFTPPAAATSTAVVASTAEGGGSRRNSRRSEIIVPNGTENHNLNASATSATSAISNGSSSSSSATDVTPVKQPSLSEELSAAATASSNDADSTTYATPKPTASERANDETFASEDSRHGVESMEPVLTPVADKSVTAESPTKSVDTPMKPVAAAEDHHTQPHSSLLAGLDPLSPSTAGKVSLAIESMEKRIEAVRQSSVAFHSSPVLPRKESFKSTSGGVINGLSESSSSGSSTAAEGDSNVNEVVKKDVPLEADVEPSEGSTMVASEVDV